MKKVISVIAVLFLILAIVAGCGEENSAPEPPEYASNVLEGAQALAVQAEIAVEQESVKIIAEDVFRGIISDAMDSLFESLAEVSFGEVDSNAYEMMLALRLNAAQGAVAEMANNLLPGAPGFDDNLTIQILDLLAVSSFELRSSVNLRDDLAVSSDILWHVQNLTEGGLSEILRIESLFVDNSIYLRIPQLLETFFGVDLDFDSDMFEGIYYEQLSVADAIDFILEHENEFRALISDVTDTFFDNLVNMSVEYDVPMTVGGRSMYFNKVVITASGSELATAAIEALEALSESDELLTLLQELDKLINPVDYTSVEELRRLIRVDINDLEKFAEDSSHEYFDIYTYIDETDLSVGFGIISHYDDAVVEIVFVEDVGFHFMVYGDDQNLRLYGSHSAGDISRGELYIFYDDNTSDVLDGKLLDFEYSDDHFSLTLSGRDFLHLYVDEVISPEEDTLSFVAELMYNLEFTLTIEGDSESVNFTLTVRHADPEISLTLEFGYALGGDISTERPSSENVIYIDISDLMSEEGNQLETLLLNEINPFELFVNLAQVLDNLSQLGFDFTELLADLMLGLF